jgi:hypothetical protein
MRAAEQANGGPVTLAGTAALAFGENLAPPVTTRRHLLPELPAEQDVPSEIKNIIDGDEHFVSRLL